MKLFKKQSFVALFMVLIPVSVFAVDLFKGDDEADVIWKAGTNVYLRYAELDTSDFGKNEHPIKLNEIEIRKALDLLIFQDDDYNEYAESAEPPTPLFTPLQVNLLSKNLSRGLIKARPDQDITFALKRSVEHLLGLKKNQFFVAGRAFYKNGKLNIIIGDYDRARQEGYENVVDPTSMGIVAYRFNHGRRSKRTKNFKQTFVEVAGIENKKTNKTYRKDWFVIDLNLASKEYDLQASTRTKDEMVGKRNELRALLGEDALSGTSAKERAQNSKERREMRAEMARMRKEMREMSGGKAASSETLEERLVTLGRLKKKGLVSDKEYQIKRKEIINDI